MLPSLPLVLTSSKDCSKICGVEDKIKCESTSRTQISSAKTTGTKTNSRGAIQSSVGQTDKIEERHPDKLLRPIAPKPVAIVCVPDIPSVRATEKEVTENVEVVPKATDDANIKIVSSGSTTKCEKDNEEEPSVTKKNSTTGRSPPKNVKKKPKQIRDLEKTLNCLLSDNEQVKDEKAFAFAQSYFLKVTETLHGKDDATYSEFMKTMNDFGVTIFDATELYKKVTKIFEKYPILSEEFLAFLLPEQAMQCGKFMEYIMITKMRSFCRKLELYYSKQPSQLRKIYSSLATLASNNKATLDDLKNTILPLLRNNSLLVNMFLELMPTEAPRASSLTDYESMDFSSVDIQNPKPDDWFETVEMPLPVEDNMYGGEDCICPCHVPPDGKTRRRSGHCVSCGTKFIQGRVYIHSGSMLRPARLSFKEMRTKAIERLSVKNLKTRRKIDKNQGSSSSNKKNNSTKDTSTNVPGMSNKMSPPKTTKKGTKNKTLNQNQKKSKKSLGSKATHKKQLSNDKKIAKPPRKRIKLLTNKSENPNTSSRKSHLVPSKKGASQVGKLACKVDAKASSKSVPQIPTQQLEISQRAARSAARNMTLSNDCNQKPNRRQSGNTVKGDTSNTSTTDASSKNSKSELLLKNKSTCLLTSSIDVVTDREGTPSELSFKSISIVGEDTEKCPLVKIECTAVLKSDNVEDNITNRTELSNDQTFKSCALPVDLSSDDKEEVISTIVNEDNSFLHDLSAASVNEEKKIAHNRKVNSSVCIDEATSEADRNNSDFKESSTQSKSPSPVCDGHLLDKSTHNNTIETFPHCGENNLQSEREDTKIEIMEFENIENVSSEDGKNVLDSEFNSSSESEIEDNCQMDIEDTGEETDEWSSSSQNYINESNKGNHSSDVMKETASERPDSTPWTRDEDKIILRTFQSVNNSDHVFQKICHELPSRTAEEVQSRFQTLMSFLQKMTGDPTSS